MRYAGGRNTVLLNKGWMNASIYIDVVLSEIFYFCATLHLSKAISLMFKRDRPADGAPQITQWQR